jgi:hypothetical protein
MKARQMKVDQNAFDVDEFIGRLKRTLGSGRKRARADDEMDENDEEENGFGDWEKLGWMGVKHSRRVCLPDFLYVCHPPFFDPYYNLCHENAHDTFLSSFSFRSQPDLDPSKLSRSSASSKGELNSTSRNSRRPSRPRSGRRTPKLQTITIQSRCLYPSVHHSPPLHSARSDVPLGFPAC